MEERPLTKENTPQPNLCRRQSRESRQSELERVRQAVCRQTSEVGTVCASSARTGLCGGRVTGIPTTTRVAIRGDIAIFKAKIRAEACSTPEGTNQFI